MKPIQHRLVLCMQQRGNLGKSTLLAGFSQYCDQRHVPWQGFDLDPDHRSLVRLFPDNATLLELGNEPEGEIIKLVRRSASAPVTIIDPRAHLGDTVMRAWEMVRFPETFAAAGGRITVLLFPGDDLEILTNIDAVVSRLADSVDYVIVRNPARQPRTRMFDGSVLEADLLRLGAVTLEVPTLLGLAKNHLSALEAELGRGVTHVEAVANQDLNLDGMVRLVIEDWLKTLFHRFDAIAGHLLPTASAEMIVRVDTASSVTAPRTQRGAKINRQNL